MMIIPRIISIPTALKPVTSNWIIRFSTRLVTFCVIFSLVCIAFFWKKLPPMIPLWLSSPWGSDQLAHPAWLFILPMGGLIIYFINLIISMYVNAEYLVFIQMLYLSSAFVNTLACIALIRIIEMVT